MARPREQKKSGPWPSRDEELIGCWKEGLSVTKIGKRMNLTRNQITGRANRLKLEGRESPIKPRITEAERRKRAAERMARRYRVKQTGEKHPQAARDVEPGQSWAFTEHRTVAEIYADREKAKAVPAGTREVLKFLTQNVGVIIYGPDDKGTYSTHGRKGMRVKELLEMANLWRSRRGEPPFVVSQPAGAAA